MTRNKKATTETIHKMIQLKNSGLTNEEIGDIVDIHPQHVGRLLKEHMNSYNDLNPSPIRYSINDLNKFAIETWNGTCESDVYKTQRTIYDWKCNRGHEFSASWYAVKIKNFWCPKCKTIKRLSKENKFNIRKKNLKEIFDRDGNFYEFSEKNIVMHITKILELDNPKVIDIFSQVSKLIFKRLYYRSYKFEAITATIVCLITPISQRKSAEYFNANLNQIRIIKKIFSDKDKKVIEKIKNKMIEIYDWKSYM